ncbi:ABC transporter substrate-binding protein [Eubacteriales bacterium OttesenSCG-928-A19]|nr:ABC transporter substrate-binding protein [Eubacteriales bacterium OttesenSCG-928-A19]
MKRTVFSLILVVALVVVMTPAFAEDTRTFVDSAGREVELPVDITRVAPSGAMAQIMLFALAPDAFVGLASAWSPEAQEFLGDYYSLPVLGQLYGSADLNLEALAAADPQVVIDLGEAKGSIVEDMGTLQEQIGVPAVHIDAATATFGDAYRTLGELLGLQERAEVLATYCEETYARAEEIMEKVSDDRVNLVYCLGSDGLNVIAKGSYHAEIIDMISNNLAVVDDPSSKGSGNPIDMEQLLLWDPEVIVFAPESIYAEVANDTAWKDLAAISSGHYIEVPFDSYNWMGFPPSVQRYLGLIWLCDAFYPEQSDYDLYEEIAHYFDLFYHAELTHEQFDRLMANARFEG